MSAPPPANRHKAADQRGREGEWLAQGWCREQGWDLLAERVKTPRGEVDIVARAPDCLVFLEVKWRLRAADLDFAIDQRRLARVAAAAEILLPRFAGAGEDVRIDVLLLAPGAPPRHIANAWMPL